MGLVLNYVLVHHPPKHRSLLFALISHINPLSHISFLVLMALQVLEHGLAGFRYLWAITLAQLLSFSVFNLHPRLCYRYTQSNFLFWSNDFVPPNQVHLLLFCRDSLKEIPTDLVQGIKNSTWKDHSLHDIVWYSH